MFIVLSCTFVHVFDIILYINCVFCFGQLRTLVAMATFLMLWLYQASSQVSVYRTIGPLVMFSQDNWAMGRSNAYTQHESVRMMT